MPEKTGLFRGLGYVVADQLGGERERERVDLQFDSLSDFANNV